MSAEYYTLKSAGSIEKVLIEGAFGIACESPDFTIMLTPLIRLAGTEAQNGGYSLSLSLEYSLSGDMKHFHSKAVHVFLNLCKDANIMVRRGSNEFFPNNGGYCSDLWSCPTYKKFSHRLEHPNDK